MELFVINDDLFLAHGRLDRPDRVVVGSTSARGDRRVLQFGRRADSYASCPVDANVRYRGAAADPVRGRYMACNESKRRLISAFVSRDRTM
jgi:hypothetical protein